MSKHDEHRTFPPIQFITVEGEEFALISLRLLVTMEDLEDLEDELLAARAAQEHDPDAPTVPGDVVHAILDGTHPVRAWREYRGMTQEELARRAGTSKAYISHIERGMRQPALALTGALAAALDAPLEALVNEIAEYGDIDTTDKDTNDAA